MTVAATFAFLTPRAAALAFLALVAVGALLVASRRAAHVRALLRLEPPPSRRLRRRAALVVAVVLLLTLATMQPVVRTRQASRSRTDAQAFVVVDASRSMAASPSPGGLRRLARAKRAAIAAAAALGDVPVGVATLTDRVLPALFPTADRAAFDSTVESLTIEDPPPRDVNTIATNFGALSELATEGFFPAGVHKRAVILVTDGESGSFDPGALADSLSGHGVKLSVLTVGSGGDRVYRPDGKPEAAYRPDRQAAALSVQRLGGVDLAALRRSLGSGPSKVVGVEPRTRSLAPVAALLALVPLLALLGLIGSGRARAFVYGVRLRA